MMERDIIVGKTYKHISGNYYRVLCIAQDTVNKDENGEPVELVIYEALDNKATFWARPYSLFNSLAPEDSVQKYRFEEIK